MTDEATTIDIGAVLRSPVLAALVLVAGGLGWKLLDGDAPAPTPGPAPVTSLRTLVDAESADNLAAFYGDFATVVRAGNVTSTGNFREAQRVAMAALQSSIDKQGWAAINGPVSDRVMAAVGEADQPLSPELRIKLADALAAIGGEFGG